jgi:hypothetical protein
VENSRRFFLLKFRICFNLLPYNWIGQLDWTTGLDNWIGQLDWNQLFILLLLDSSCSKACREDPLGLPSAAWKIVRMV